MYSYCVEEGLFVELRQTELEEINGGGIFAAAAVVVIGVVVTAVTIATVPPAAPLVGKVFIAIGGAITTGAGAHAAYQI